MIQLLVYLIILITCVVMGMHYAYRRGYADCQKAALGFVADKVKKQGNLRYEFKNGRLVIYANDKIMEEATADSSNDEKKIN